MPLAVAGLLAGVVAPSHAADKIRVGPRFFGIHDGSFQAYGRVEFGSVRLWDTGTTWRQIETSPGHYNWTRLDSLVSSAQEHGVRVMLVLGMTPSFYADSRTVPPTDLAHYTDYVRAAMQRYRHFDGRRGIESYQVWNEGNVTAFWTGSPHQLAELTRIVDRVRDQVDPGARVVAPSFAARLPSQRRWISEYQEQRVGGHPVWRHYDVNALSLYPRAEYGSRAGGPEDAVRLLRRVRSGLDKAGVPHRRPIWGTEINYGLQPGGPGTTTPADAISRQRQVANVLRTYILGAARGLERVYWYRYDWGRVNGGTLGNTLLADPDDWSRASQAGRALRTAQRWLHGRLIAQPGHRRPCSHDRAGTYTCTLRRGHALRTIHWNPRRTVHVRIRGATSLVDQQGRSTDIRAGRARIRVDYRPVLVRSRHAH